MMRSDASALPSARRPAIFTRWSVMLASIAVLVPILVIVLYMQRAVDIEAVSPTVKDIESTVSTTGTVIPTDEFPAHATFAGIVDRIYVHLGEKVHAGQLLIQMRDQYAASRVATARAALLTAEVNKQNLLMNGSKEDRIAAASDLGRAAAEQSAAAKGLATLRQLHQVGSASDAELTAATQRLQTATAALTAAQQRLQSRYRPIDLQNAQAKIAADRASLAAERISYSNAYVTSPITGTVYLIPVNQYDFVQMGADLLHVADLNKISVRANFFEPDITNLAIGEPVTITWNGHPGRTWSGTIQSKPMAVTGEGILRTGQCTIGIAGNGDGLPINTNVTVTVSVEKHSHAVTLPREAVHTEGSSHYVFRVVGSHLKKTPVQVGLLNAQDLEITRGITSRDKVALRAKDGGKLRNGQLITQQGL